MGDVSLIWNLATGYADIAMDGPDLESGHDLETAILISLFTDHVADTSDILPPDFRTDPRGWWPDVYTQDPIGSKLWQVMNRVTNQDTLNFTRDTVLKSLQWMLDDGVAAGIDVATSYPGKGNIRIDIAIAEPNGVTTPFSYVWGRGTTASGALSSSRYGTDDFGSPITTDLDIGAIIT